MDVASVVGDAGLVACWRMWSPLDVESVAGDAERRQWVVGREPCVASGWAIPLDGRCLWMGDAVCLVCTVCCVGGLMVPR